MQKSSIILIAVITLVAITSAAAQGRFVGGRTAVSNVKSNKEVQELGRYCVEEFNRSSHLLTRSSAPSAAPLRFVEVVEAQRQVVAGIKYYLTVETVQGGYRRVFDAQVVVKPWVQSKQLLSFAPSTKFV